jgi:hypothetical protein
MKPSLNIISTLFALLFVVPLLFMRGMFMDGQMYSAVSLNMAEGIGEFWRPIYGADFFGLDGFYENPPLGLYNLALFFKVLGTSFWVESLFLLSFLLLSFLGVWLNIKEILGKEAKYHYWFVIVIWFSISTVFWTFRHNMMEVQLIPILLFTNWWILRSIRAHVQPLLASFCLAIFIMLSFLVKGPVGVFLLSAPFIYYLVISRQRRILGIGFMTIIFTSLLGLALIQIPIAKEFFNQYLLVRTAERLSNNPTVDSRFWIVKELFMQLIPALIIIGLILFLRTKKERIIDSKWSFYFILVAVSGSMPLIISYVQRPFYLATSFPFYAIGLSLTVVLQVKKFAKRLIIRYNKSLNVINILLLILLIVLTSVNWGKIKRDDVLLDDIDAYVSKEYFQDNVYVTDQLIFNWSLKAYMMRFGRVDLRSFHGFDPDVSSYLLTKDYVPQTDHGTFELVDEFASFNIYCLKKT